MTHIHLIETEAVPCKDSEAFEKYSGAYVNAYVAINSEEEALVLATKEIEDAGWKVVKLESIKKMKRGELRTAKGREYFDQSLSDECVLVFHVWSATEHSDHEVN
jgi:hypothetical protein